jgi:hypothetical protein
MPLIYQEQNTSHGALDIFSKQYSIPIHGLQVGSVAPFRSAWSSVLINGICIHHLHLRCCLHNFIHYLISSFVNLSRRYCTFQQLGYMSFWAENHFTQQKSSELKKKSAVHSRAETLRCNTTHTWEQKGKIMLEYKSSLKKYILTEDYINHASCK